MHLFPPFLRVLGRRISSFGPARLFARTAPLCGATALLLFARVAPNQAITAVRIPAAMVYDTAGNLYIADAGRHQILELSVGGVLTAVVGTGEQGFAGDGGSASNALLNEPQGVALGADGTLYIADTGNHRIRTVAQGVIHTIAGSAAVGDGGDGGAAASASFVRPTALAVSPAGGLLVCDTGTHRVRLIANGSVSAFAGSGIQGFSGDGGSASTAQLDSPEGIAALPDGRILISDSSNQRLRVVGADGKISTVAGTGVRGYSGDGGPAVAAKLSFPRGIAVLADGSFAFADSDNQSIRRVDAAGKISTIGGSGAQGAATDAGLATGALLNVPKSVAVSPFGAVAFGDASGSTLKALAGNGGVYFLPAPAGRVSTVKLVAPQQITYGQASAVLTVSAAVPAQGNVQVMEAGTSVGSGTLDGGAATVTLASLTAADHTVIAQYAGDGLNPAAQSAPSMITVQPAPVVATANPTSIAYGEALPALSGSVSGVLPQDAANVSVVFSASAPSLPDAGAYPITASLAGSGSTNYTLTNGASAGSLSVVPAQSKTAMQTVSQASYAGLPLTLTASVSPQFAGSPSGDVAFLESGAVIAHGTLIQGLATASYLGPAAGSHNIVASYGGNNDFLPSTSVSQAITVNALPDFSVSSSNVAQSVQAGLIASFLINTSPQGGAFTGSVTFSVSGLPQGATATFTPIAVVPGTTGASTTLNIQTPAQRAARRSERWPEHLRYLAFACLLPVLLLRRRRIAIVAVLSALTLPIVGCGARTIGSTESTSHTYPLLVTATSTNLVSAVVTHSVALSLTVQ